ncbi:MAG: DUF2235 domain-containing protein [Defluviimonas sp.]|uniref:DUF2235 domain-containing protein n=1 Tax=Albidovulum sp. TaxID=1872424 RepID=UPI001DCCB073|nr:DUF2235 domain-containing protein [Paracoccaceae bacterium]MCC0063784.1 DUF2235 domain-containing protein [Defluviimonas sp.]
MRLASRLLGLLGFARKAETRVPVRGRGPVDHVILLDGTASTLDPGWETNIGLIYRLLQRSPGRSHMSLYYEAGVQWHGWRELPDVAMGRGMNRRIRRAYGWLATRYRPGDRVFFFGYSRGAYAVRSLAGMMSHVGLLRADQATERNVQLAWRYYQREATARGIGAFRSRFCHNSVPVEMIGVFDTVKALGIRLPFLWMWSEPQHEFHDHTLGPTVRHGYQALAMNENRAAFDPVLWDTTTGDWRGRVEQVWFRGAHGDVGGQLGGFEAARPLANLPLVWMLERVEGAGLALPDGWRAEYPTDPAAPSVGTARGWGKAFLLRARRKVGRDPSESLHPSTERPRPRWSLPDLPLRRRAG